MSTHTEEYLGLLCKQYSRRHITISIYFYNTKGLWDHTKSGQWWQRERERERSTV